MDITESLERVMQSKTVFGDKFYNVFLTRYPHVRQHFDGVDMAYQSLLLTMALQIVEQYYQHGFAAMERYLQHLGAKHRVRAVPQEQFPHWSAAMLATLAEFHGEDWSESLAAEWTEAIQEAIDAMFDGYAQPVQI